MDINKVNEVLNKYKIIENEVNNLEQRQQQLNNELIKEQTLLQQNLDELKQYDILPQNVEKEIENITIELEKDIKEYEQLSGTTSI